MKQYFRTVLGCATLMLLLADCKQVYDPRIGAKNIRLLVVEGFLNSGQGATVVRLSRTGDLTDTTIHLELGAQVNVEGDDNSNFPLVDNANGEYSIPQLNLNNNVKYRLHIKTIDGKEYVSDYSSVKYTPAIDSITSQRENGGAQFYVNAHDPQIAAKYYQWKYEETWEFHSAYYSSLLYTRDSRTNRVTDVAYRDAFHNVDTTIYKCWKTFNSSSIILGSTEKLTSDVVYLPVQYIEPHSEKLGILYSLNLRQYAISHEAYLFLQKIKKNTEQLGSIFDAQPSELSGNIHCLTDPNEIVIGFAEVSQEQTKRIFVYNSQFPDWNYDPGCVRIEIDNNLDSIAKYGADLLPATPSRLSSLGGIIAFYASTPPCVDCTLKGTNQKPDFWP